MKEAAGEANMTVITIVLIGVVAAVGAIFIPRILNGIESKSCCTETGGVWFKNNCYVRSTCTINNSGQVTSCNGSGSYTPSC